MSSPDDLVQADIDGQIVTMPRSMADLLGQPPIALTVDGKKVQVPHVSVTQDPRGKAVPRLTTLYDAALKAGVQIPILCHREYMNPVAVCRVCSVHVGFENRPAESAPRSRLLSSGRGGHGRRNASNQSASFSLRQDADGTAAGRSSHPLRQAKGSRGLRIGDVGRPVENPRSAIAARSRTPAARRYLSGDRRRSQRLHFVRPLLTRL